MTYDHNLLISNKSHQQKTLFEPSEWVRAVSSDLSGWFLSSCHQPEPLLTPPVFACGLVSTCYCWKWSERTTWFWLKGCSVRAWNTYRGAPYWSLFCRAIMSAIWCNPLPLWKTSHLKTSRCINLLLPREIYFQALQRGEVHTSPFSPVQEVLHPG